jgi:hypothetical protein
VGCVDCFPGPTTGVTHRTGFRLPATTSGKVGLMDSIRSVNPNARLDYTKGLKVKAVEGRSREG